MSSIRVENVQCVIYGGHTYTLFSVFTLKGDCWVFDYNDKICGHFKRASTVLRKITAKGVSK